MKKYRRPLCCMVVLSVAAGTGTTLYAGTLPQEKQQQTPVSGTAANDSVPGRTADYRRIRDDLDSIRELNPEMLRLLRAEMPEGRETYRLFQKEPPDLAGIQGEIKAAEIRLRLLEGRYQREKDEEKKAEMVPVIREEIENLYDMKVEKRRMEIRFLEGEIQRLRNELDASVQNREESIGIKLKQITRGDVFNW